MAKQRLQKFLASAGVDSRRNCEQLILDGVVKVNRKRVDTLPAFVDPEIDVVSVQGKKVEPVEKLYYLLNKPKGVVCTSSDPYKRKTAVSMISTDQRVVCVGRLDMDSTGAIILTSDTELVNRLTHPKYELSKKYLVEVKGRLEGPDIEILKKGVYLAEGKTKPSAIKIMNRGHTSTLVQITISQGLNRQLRRMLAKVGHKVTSLKRTHIGKIELRGLGVGRSRKLTKTEIAYLKKV